MAIPDFQTLMLPLLSIAGDGQEHLTSDCLEILSTQFGITEKERAEMLPSGGQPVFKNRVHWAKAYLKMSGLITNTRRGSFKITDRGLKTLSEKPAKINLQYLKQFEDYLEQRESWKSNSQAEEPEASVDHSTPREKLESSFQQIKNALASDLLEKVKNCSWQFFEQLVVDLLVKMGYGGTRKDASEVIRKTGDEGIDGIIKEDKLGLDTIYVQAKKWEGSVGRPEIQKFVGALAGQGAKKGIFITTSRFSSEAKEYVPKNETKIVLIDGERLVDLMIDYDLGVAVKETYQLKEIDSDFFVEE
jgi:restriction system protein